MSILSVDQIQPIGSGTTITLNATEIKTGTEITVGTGASIFSPAGNTLTFGTNNVERIRIKNDGKVGINTSNTSNAKLEISDRSTGTFSGLAVGTQYGTSLFGGYNNYPAIMNSNQQPLIYCDTNNDRTELFGDTVGFGTTCAFRVNNAERLRIGSSGQIGLSGANYGTSGQVLTSQGSGSAVQWASSSSHTLLHTVSLDLVSAGSNTKTQALNLSGYLKLYGLITGVQRSTTTGDMWLTFNGSNTSGQYAWIRSYIDNGGNVVTSGSQNGIAYSSVGPGFFGNIAGVNAYTSGNNYWAFTLHGIQENGKVYESHSVGYLNNNMVVNTTGYFQQSAAITSITFNVYNSTYRTSGGTMKLYGVK